MTRLEEHLTDKQRIVFAGTTGCPLLAGITAHVLRHLGRRFDFIKGAEIIQQDSGAAIALIDAGEEKSSDGTPLFLKFQHHFGVITGISYDKDNGFGTEDEYIRLYDQFADATPKGGMLAYSEHDPVAGVLCNKERADVAYVPFKSPQHIEENGFNYLITSHKDRIKIHLKNKLDLQYYSGAKEILKKLGITSEQFYQAITQYQPS
ncbi:MAG: hypothetical protein FJZ78_04050 [Bacteroidetes bacterium]|nr:hypothetical protein [Bacteroidota bacterium]